MSKVTARTKIKGKQYEIHVDLDEALKVKEGSGDITAALDSPNIYYDIHKGTIASQSDLKDAFGSIDTYEIAKKIISTGEIQKTQEFRDQEREQRIKQVLTLLLKNAVDQHGRPFTEERLRSAVQEVHFNFDANKQPEQQMRELLHKLKEIIPIKIETKKVKLIIPARFTGQVYGILKGYKESEEWLSNGDLQTILNIPSGMLIDFYEKVNDATHGAVQSEEMGDQGSVAD
jgi:ribosome maturation protein SDO1